MIEVRVLAGVQTMFDKKRQCGGSSMVEYDLAKVGVAGSNPVHRSQ